MTDFAKQKLFEGAQKTFEKADSIQKNVMMPINAASGVANLTITLIKVGAAIALKVATKGMV